MHNAVSGPQHEVMGRDCKEDKNGFSLSRRKYTDKMMERASN
jgi:hypothetical protein